MSFPPPTDYAEAIQNPSSAFLDAELKSGVNVGPLMFGMPGPVASGNFAVVYRFRCGAKSYAVKCFTRQPPNDQEKRFASIHNHLLESRLSCATQFQFLPKGIRVRGTFYPILKMEWLDAPTLLDFVPRNIHDREVFRKLSESFLAVCKELRTHKIAHGDLQHGNLLVSAGGLKLIDYDGMCVPGTAGLPSEEDGLPHYQHPCRHGGRLSQNFDHFPSLVIWISLYALSIDPSLWTRYVRDDERLLFKKEDFLKPQDSAIIRELLSYGESRLSQAVVALRDSCASRDLAMVPSLNDVLASVSTSVDPEWWKGEASSGAKVVFAERTNASGQNHPDWKVQDAGPPLPARFKYSIVWDRILAFTYVGVVAIGVACTYMGTMALGSLVIGGLGIGSLIGARLLSSYLDSIVVAQKRECLVRLRSASTQLAKKDAVLKRFKSTQEAQIEQMARPLKEHEAKLGQLQARARQLQSELDVQLQSVLQTLSTERQQIDSRERNTLQTVSKETRQLEEAHSDRLRRIETERSRISSDATAQMDALRRDKEKKKEARFQLHCDEFVRAELMKIPIRATSVASLTGANVKSLHDRGICFAGDFIDSSSTTGYRGISQVVLIVRPDGTRVKVPGIGEKRVNELIQWRHELVRRALRRAPSALPQQVIDAIESETAQRRQNLLQQVKAASEEATRLRNEAEQLHGKRKAELANIESNARQTSSSSRSALDGREKQERQNVEVRKAEALAPINREIWQLQSVINPARHQIDQLRNENQRSLAGTSDEYCKLRAAVSSLEMQRLQYKNIRWGRYLSRVFVFAGENEEPVVR